MVKGKLHVEFVRQDLTSYSGLELLRRYLRQLDLPSRLRAACATTGGDYGEAVSVVGEPGQVKLVESLARPGGNVTGLPTRAISSSSNPPSSSWSSISRPPGPSSSAAPR